MQVLGWAPSISLREGVTLTFAWIKQQVEAEGASGGDVAALAHSHQVKGTI